MAPIEDESQSEEGSVVEKDVGLNSDWFLEELGSG